MASAFVYDPLKKIGFSGHSHASNRGQAAWRSDVIWQCPARTGSLNPKPANPETPKPWTSLKPERPSTWIFKFETVNSKNPKRIADVGNSNHGRFWWWYTGLGSCAATCQGAQCPLVKGLEFRVSGSRGLGFRGLGFRVKVYKKYPVTDNIGSPILL